MAAIGAWGAHEVARIICDQVTTNKGVVLPADREFVMTSDGRVLTRFRDGPSAYTLSMRHVPVDMRNRPGLIELAEAHHYRVVP